MKMMIAAACFTLVGVMAAGAEEDRLCVGPACVEHHHHHDRDHWREGHAEHCKSITIHEDGVTKHIRKCGGERMWR